MSELDTGPTWSQVRARLPEYVGRRVAQLGRAYRDDSPDAVATLARLRRLVNRAPGEDLESVTEVDEEVLGVQRSQEPSHVEWAVHLAMCLHAFHQQSQHDKDMHQPGNGFGAAVGALMWKGTSQLAVRRRFTAAATAVGCEELAVHLRGLIGQLRYHQLTLDYGKLAADLFAWQHPDAAPSVRRTWGRDFHRAMKRTRQETTEEQE